MMAQGLLTTDQCMRTGSPPGGWARPDLDTGPRSPRSSLCKTGLRRKMKKTSWKPEVGASGVAGAGERKL